MEIRDVSMTLLTASRSTESSPRGVRAAHPGRTPRRRRQFCFPRHQEVEESWKILDPIEEYWAAHGRPAQYASGSWGPREADEMLARDGRSWRRP
ncbi:hypothetical protein LT493_22070 [Streptomyces tricolor]|nr:hypothetical protein [Streptomyces tricolor]